MSFCCLQTVTTMKPGQQEQGGEGAGEREALITGRPCAIYYQAVQNTEILQMVPWGISWP